MKTTKTLATLLVMLKGATIVAQDPAQVVAGWLGSQREVLELSAGDVAAWSITNMSTDRKGVTYVYIRQEVNGLPVFSAVANFALREGGVVHFGDRLQRGLAGRAPSAIPALSAEEAMHRACLELGLSPDAVRVLEVVSDTEMILTPSGVSHDPIPARLIYQPTVDGGLRLAWDLTIRSTSTINWWHLGVDAITGSILRNTDHIVQCAHPHGGFERPWSAWEQLQRTPVAMQSMPRDGSGYRVFPFPTESPSHGPHVVVSDPADASASPYGWHDIDGASGAEYTMTRGNNVYAYEDIADLDQPGYSPDGGASLSFDFPFTPPQAPLDYLDASITNLFYSCNVLHDVLHRYGFDEASGNFQWNNFGHGGAGEDEVIAEAQDGSGMNNANFGTPSDGSSGRMQMYLWRTSSDSTLFVNSPTPIAGVYTNAVAGFGPPLPGVPITADVVLAVDALDPVNNACEGIINGAQIAGRIALVDRGGCTFIAKVQALQNSGALAVIVVNNVPGAPIAMGGTGGGDIVIPSVMISQADGLLIKQALLGGSVNATLAGTALEDFRDSGFDNGIIAHEYGHGVSNRLTGGGFDVDCLWNDEQMGEGWSDYIGMVLTMLPGDEATTIRGVGTFVRDQATDGPGIRPAPYTTEFAVNDYTYGDTNDPSLSQPHGVGFVWATMLWDMTWALIDVEGFDGDLYTGNAGNNVAIQLMMDGLKLQPCNPGFVDGRDAILLADSLNNGGSHSCLLWNVFAQRGLGYSADQGSSFDRFDQIEAFDLPPACLNVGIADVPLLRDLQLMPNPATSEVLLSLSNASADAGTVRLISADGRIVRTWPMPAGITRTTLDLGGLAPALYVVELNVAGAVLKERLVVQ